MVEDCFECEKSCEPKAISADEGGLMYFCSLKCAEKYIKKNWFNYVRVIN